MTSVSSCGCSRTFLAARGVGGSQTRGAAWGTGSVQLLLLMLLTVLSSSLAAGQSAEENINLQLASPVLEAPGKVGARRQLASSPPPSPRALPTIPYGDLQLANLGCTSAAGPNSAGFGGFQSQVTAWTSFKRVYTVKFDFRLNNESLDASPLAVGEVLRLFASDDPSTIPGEVPLTSYAKGAWMPAANDPLVSGVTCGSFLWSFCDAPVSLVGLTVVRNVTYSGQSIARLTVVAGSDEFCVSENGTVIATGIKDAPSPAPAPAPAPSPAPGRSHKKRSVGMGTSVAAVLVEFLVASLLSYHFCT